MGDWLNGIIGAISGGIRALAREVKSKILGIWNLLTTFFGLLRSAWAELFAAFKAVYPAVGAMVSEIWHSMSWLIQVAIPRAVNYAFNVLKSLTVAWINNLDRVLRAVISTLERWARATISALSNSLNAVLRWARTEFDKAWSFITWTYNKVRDLLVSPAKLAAWAIGEIWKAWWKLAWSQREPIARFVWSNSAKLAVAALATAEDLITRII